MFAFEMIFLRVKNKELNVFSVEYKIQLFHKVSRSALREYSLFSCHAFFGIKSEKVCGFCVCLVPFVELRKYSYTTKFHEVGTKRTEGIQIS